MPRAAVTCRFENKVGPYLDALRAAGAEPIGVTPDRPLSSLDGIDGLVLTGGTDLAPWRYGQSPRPEAQAPDEERDELEFRLLREALEHNLPVLAICRGMQLFNVFHHGTLLQHTGGHVSKSSDPAEPAHSVQIVDGTRLAGIFGIPELRVNSRHHQAVDRAGAGLVISARSVTDAVIEGLERPDRRFALAVQWHPEDQPGHAPLFEAFVEAA